MSELTHEQIRGLLEGYALAILTEDEAQIVARHLQGCADCRADLAAYRRVTDELALATADEALDAARGAALRQRLMARIQTRGQETGAGLWEKIAATLQGWKPVAVALTVLIVLSIALWWQQGRDAQNAGERQITLTATDAAPDARGVIQFAIDTGRGTLAVEGLPVLAANRQYQLWLIKDGDRVSGGVFSVTDEGDATITIAAPDPIDNYAAYGITIEPFGGSPGPTGERVLGYNL